MTLLAKDNGQSLYIHSILAYDYGMKLIDWLPFSNQEREELKGLSSFPLLFHDIGKGATGFQEALEKRKNWRGKRHEILSAVFLKQFGLSSPQIFAVITHHKDIPHGETKNVLPEEQLDQLEGDTPLLHSMKKEFEHNGEKIALLCKQLLDYVKNDSYFNISMDLGLGIEEYWLDGFYDSRNGQMRKVSLEERIIATMLRGIVRGADHLASAGIAPKEQIDLRNFIITSFELREFQRKCSRAEKDIILIAPTGSGKTEALLLWAQNNQKENARVFYVLPYQASINAMHKRLSKIFDQENVGVLHSNAVSYLYGLQEEEGLEAQAQAKSLADLTKEIYYPIRVCTPHQLLRLALKGKGWELLYLEMTNSLVMYDEIHAFEPIIVGLTLATAKLLKEMGAKIAFASATLPIFLRKLILEKVGDCQVLGLDRESFSDREVMDKKRHNIVVLSSDFLANLDLIKEKIKAGKKVLLITNHVKSAQILYKELECYQPLVMHSRFTKGDRRKKEAFLLGEEKPQVVIATQVIEVSLDIDYEVMFTEPAPIDALTQRFGRINRKGSRNPEDIYVFEKQISKHKMYDQDRVEKTLDKLKGVENPLSEQELVKIINEVYEDGYSKEEYSEFLLGYSSEAITSFVQNMIAGVSRKWIEDFINKIDGSCDVLPIVFLEEYENYMEEGLWVKAQELLVPVRFQMVKEYLQKTEKDILLVDCLYCSNLGLQIGEKPSNFLGLD